MFSVFKARRAFPMGPTLKLHVIEREAGGGGGGGERQAFCLVDKMCSYWLVHKT